MLNILFILLGSHVPELLYSRIDTAVQFALSLNNTNVHWFLSGGKKNPLDTFTESEQMMMEINNIKQEICLEFDWNYIYDNVSTNTAENFIMVNKYLNNTSIAYENIYVITSQFHYHRANKIASQIIDDKIDWILAPKKLHDSIYWESIHIKNVDQDVRKAKEKLI
jgi:uncharacterized SAM-binding protein YcdF (DUF218 family)